MANCLLGLGSNLGDRAAHLQAALQHLGAIPQTRLTSASSFRDTLPAGGPAAQDPYLNAAAVVETSLSPEQLLAKLQRIENELGRVRTDRWGPRTIDLDLLLYDHLELASATLTLPHPRMSFRRFVLEPAAEVAAKFVYPINHWSIEQLLGHLNRRHRVVVLRSHDGSKTRLLESLAGCDNVRVSFQRKPTAAECRARDLANLQSIRAVGQGSVPPPQTGWQILDWNVTRIYSSRLSESGVRDAGSPPSLVVIWQPEITEKLAPLDRARRKKTSGPSLWIPGIPLELARQEVIAAMAAME